VALVEYQAVLAEVVAHGLERRLLTTLVALVQQVKALLAVQPETLVVAVVVAQVLWVVTQAEQAALTAVQARRHHFLVHL
jgi:hypothetical protein